jgi:hypothetical protein
MFRGLFFTAAVAATFVGGLGVVVLPGRIVLDVLGAGGPEAGRHAVFISGVFYAAAALVAAVERREAAEPDVALDLAA